MEAKASITVWKPREETFRRWCDLAVRPDAPLRLAPVEILDRQEGRSVGWRSLDDADEGASGAIVFAETPGGDGTELHLAIDYSVTGGKLGEAVKKLTGDESLQQAKDDLRRFKQIVETGEVVRSHGTPEGHSAARHLSQRPAQPAEGATA